MATLINTATKSKKTISNKTKPISLAQIIANIELDVNKKQGECQASFVIPKSNQMNSKSFDTLILAISKAIVNHAASLGINVITDSFINPNLFQKVYFTEHELLLGYTQRVKHNLLLEMVHFYLDIDIEDNVVCLNIVATDLEPQILSNPKDWMARVRNLKSSH